ncbi:hypothetical protein ACFPM0_17690 [Pseudonocardia sulfidoxydans]|uniref:hypothetical protein n=1 Tax=Pseudonocardia sulfidoxydans TaxID=54011 RepID=UPI003611175A
MPATPHGRVSEAPVGAGSTTFGDRTNTRRYRLGRVLGMSFADTTQVSDSVEGPLLPNRDPGYGALPTVPVPLREVRLTPCQ